MYIERITKAGKTLEISRYHVFPNVGSPSSPRNGKEKPTPPRIQKANYKSSVRHLRQLINTNYHEWCSFVTLTYSNTYYTGSPVDAKRDIQAFIRRLKYHAEGKGIMLKYIYVYGFSDTDDNQKGRLHIHLLSNLLLDNRSLEKWWGKGYVHNCELNADVDFSKIAGYMVKNQREAKAYAISIGEKIKQWYSPSRGLAKPVSTKRTITEKECRKEPKDTPGYFIDKERTYSGVSRSGYYYSEAVYVKLNLEKSNKPDLSHKTHPPHGVVVDIEPHLSEGIKDNASCGNILKKAALNVCIAIHFGVAKIRRVLYRIKSKIKKLKCKRDMTYDSQAPP